VDCQETANRNFTLFITIPPPAFSVCLQSFNIPRKDLTFFSGKAKMKYAGHDAVMFFPYREPGSSNRRLALMSFE
jgi:hypothetical protein